MSLPDNPGAILTQAGKLIEIDDIVEAASNGNGGSSSLPDSMISVFSNAAVTPLDEETELDFTGAYVALTSGSDLELADNGVNVLTTGRYVIEIDTTLRPSADSVGVAVIRPVFHGSDNWITLSEGGTWWMLVDALTFGPSNPEFTRTFPPVTLTAGDRVNVRGSWAAGTGDGGDIPTHDALLTIVRVA